MKRVTAIAPFFMLALMGCMFYFSSQVGADTDAVSHRFCWMVARVVYTKLDTYDSDTQLLIAEGMNHTIRKFAHFAIYAGMGFFGYFWLCRRRYVIPVTIGIVIGYACFDEFHQSFVEGRTPLVSDVCIDTCGAMFGIYVAVIVLCVSFCVFQSKTLKRGVWLGP